MTTTTTNTTVVSTETGPKPGYLTTEFWTTLFVHLLAVAALVATLMGKTLNKDHYAAIIPTAALVASAVAQLAYSQARAKTKQAHIAALGEATTDVSGLIASNASLLGKVGNVVGPVAGTVSSLLGVPSPSAQPQPPLLATSNVASAGVTTTDQGPGNLA